MKIGPGDELELAIRSMKVRGEAVMDLLAYAVAALAEVGVQASRAGEDEIVEHVQASLGVVQERIHALRGPEDTDAT